MELRTQHFVTYKQSLNANSPIADVKSSATVPGNKRWRVALGAELKLVGQIRTEICPDRKVPCPVCGKFDFLGILV